MKLHFLNMWTTERPSFSINLYPDISCYCLVTVSLWLQLYIRIRPHKYDIWSYDNLEWNITPTLCSVCYALQIYLGPNYFVFRFYHFFAVPIIKEKSGVINNTQKDIIYRFLSSAVAVIAKIKK